MALPTIPKGWTARGDLPDIDPRVADEDRLQALDEDMAQIVDSTSDITLDIGWYPTASRSGRYVCRAIASNEWQVPLAEFETPSRVDVFEWINDWFTEARQVVGEQSQLSDEAVASVLVVFVEPVLPQDERSGMRPHRETASTVSFVRSQPIPASEYAS
ncbi:MAG: hypothetical protein HY017_28665 [Betaproteobacteria bacterium]|nr:hypothetical protein [Betaproteobacteria bacterium]